jgi:hypothetical protein
MSDSTSGAASASPVSPGGSAVREPVAELLEETGCLPLTMRGRPGRQQGPPCPAAGTDHPRRVRR